MANVFEFQMRESFLTGYAEYLKQLKAAHPKKTFAVEISINLIPDGIGYEVAGGPNIGIIEVDAQGLSRPVEVTLDPTGDMEQLAQATKIRSEEIKDDGDTI